MSTIEFFAAGTPKGQPRPRAFAFHGKARMYDPATAEGWKQSVFAGAMAHKAQFVHGAPAVVSLTFAFRRPKCHFGKNGLKPSAPVDYTQKPDVDNLAKAVLDALTTAGAWRDDADVVRLTATKHWENATRNEGCSVVIQYHITL